MKESSIMGATPNTDETKIEKTETAAEPVPKVIPISDAKQDGCTKESCGCAAESEVKDAVAGAEGTPPGVDPMVAAKLQHDLEQIGKCRQGIEEFTKSLAELPTEVTLELSGTITIDGEAKQAKFEVPLTEEILDVQLNAISDLAVRKQITERLDQFKEIVRLVDEEGVSADIAIQQVMQPAQ